MDSEETGNIVEFSPPKKIREKDKMVFSFRVKKPGCKHGAYIVDVDERFVECEDCGAKIDPWDIILGWAEKDLIICRAVGYYEMERDRLVKEVHELTKQEKKLKALIKRLDMKVVRGKPAGNFRGE